MEKARRQIIRIDETKCNGCGACVPACKEGALRIIDGKARLVSEVFCDGLGACLGECPTGALMIEEREAEGFDAAAVEASHPSRSKPSERESSPSVTNAGHGGVSRDREGERIGCFPSIENDSLRSDLLRDGALPCGCPGTMVRTLSPKGAAPSPALTGERAASELRQWPVQLHLIPPNAPYLDGADLVLMADCTGFAFANAHRDFIRGRAIAIACPKLDDTGPYLQKLVAMIQHNRLRSIEVVMMEVPCCGGLLTIAQQAVAQSGVNVPLIRTVISLEGEVLSRGAEGAGRQEERR